MMKNVENERPSASERFREFLETSAGKVTAAAIILVAGAMIYYSVRSNFGPTDAGRMASDRMFIDAKTGKSFWYTLKKGDKIPVYSKSSGENAGYPAEMCYWNKDGTIRKEGFPVLLNTYKGEPEPTFCPDCGRLVVGHNPPAAVGRKAPPTQEEYRARKTGNAGTDK